MREDRPDYVEYLWTGSLRDSEESVKIVKKLIFDEDDRRINYTHDEKVILVSRKNINKSNHSFCIDKFPEEFREYKTSKLITLVFLKTDEEKGKGVKEVGRINFQLVQIYDNPKIFAFRTNPFVISPDDDDEQQECELVKIIYVDGENFRVDKFVESKDSKLERENRTIILLSKPQQHSNPPVSWTNHTVCWSKDDKVSVIKICSSTKICFILPTGFENCFAKVIFGAMESKYAELDWDKIKRQLLKKVESKMI
jgi:hypothetical protein